MDHEEEIATLKAEIKDVKEHTYGPAEICRKEFVTKDAFSPVRAVVYGLVSLIMSGTVIYLLSLVFKKVVP